MKSATTRGALFRRGRPASIVLTMLAGLTLFLAACSGRAEEQPAEIIIETPAPTPTATARPTRTPTPTPTETAEALLEGIPSVTSLTTFIAEHGYPEDATFARVRIPVLGVDARVASRYVGGDGVMPNPVGPADVVWYDLSAWSGLGGEPGSGGNAIFSGHVDYNATVRYADVHYRGQGVFGQLQRLSEGDVIEVDYNGETLRYAVTWTRQLHASEDDWAPIWRRGGRDAITLYTCGGEFDTVSRQYSDRVVVRAERI